MGLGIELETEDCPLFQAGLNCTDTWWDAISPHGFNFFYILVVMYAISSIVSFAYLMKECNCCALSFGRTLRTRTLVSVALTGVAVAVFVGFGAGIRYPTDSVFFKLSVVSLLIVNTYSIQNGQEILFMYIESCNSTLSKSMLPAALHYDLLKRFMTPYDMWIANVILTGILVFSPETFPNALFVIRFSFVMTGAHIAALAILLPYYLNQLVKVLNGVLSSFQSSSNNLTTVRSTERESWQRLALRSRQLARYLAVIGPIMSMIHFAAALSELLSFVLGYYVFLLFWMGGHYGFVLGQLIILRPKTEDKSNRSRYVSKGDDTLRNSI
mmetsp:Transcript_16076/g.18201  ORF Transcript_16076/g.18201 Transcript_16076/m.18201 type:complete len:327 (+) Transcript_16076:103-1083(+)